LSLMYISLVVFSFLKIIKSGFTLPQAGTFLYLIFTTHEK